MILFLLFIYLLNASIATNSTDNSITIKHRPPVSSTTRNNNTPGYDMSKSIICFYDGQRSNINPNLDDLDPDKIPSECDFIFYTSVSINQSSMICINETLLQKVIDLKKRIILPISRQESYTGWTAILGTEGNENETKILCDFATKHNIQGYIIYDTFPSDNEAINNNNGKNIIPYIKQLKKFCPPSFLIGIEVSVIPKILKNTNIYNFEALNDIVTFYELDTMELNTCKPELYNGVTPITKSKPGENYLYGLEEVVSNLQETKICFKKLVFIIPVFTYNVIEGGYPTYSEMCEEKINSSTWCIQTSENYYNKGKYFQDLQVGIKNSGLDWDDYGNTCKCKSAFNGFYNIHAGYTGGSVIPCANFDVQSTIYPIK